MDRHQGSVCWPARWSQVLAQSAACSSTRASLSIKRLAGIRRTLPAVFSLTIPNKSQSRIKARPQSPFRCRPSPEPNERLLLDRDRLRDIDGRHRRVCPPPPRQLPPHPPGGFPGAVPPRPPRVPFLQGAGSGGIANSASPPPPAVPGV